MSDELQSAEAAEAAFYQAFSATDVQAMDRVWLDRDTAVCIHPGGGLLLGKAEVMQSWTEIFSGATPPHIEYRLLSVIEAPSIRVHLVEELIRTGGNPDARPNRVVATNVYVRDGGSWRMSTHHASLPLMAKRGSEGRDRQLH